MSSRRFRKLVVLLVLITGASAVSALQDDRRLPRAPVSERRVALIVGNDSYPGAPLRNARNDARAVAEALKELGFDVTRVEDVTRQGFTDAVSDFGRRLQTGDVALFYFAGHGVQVDGENFLIPVDFRGQSASEIRLSTLRAGDVQQVLARAHISLLLLDACRDNPFSGTRGMGRGLAPMEALGGLVAFATGAGQTAADNPSGPNGLFTTQLIRVLRESGLNAQDVLLRVRQNVARLSGGRQVPVVYDGLLTQFVFRTERASGASPSGDGLPDAVPTSDKPRDEPRGLGIRWARIPSGTFQMGCVPGDNECDSAEKPRHAVTLTKAYDLMTTELTLGAFRAFASIRGRSMPNQPPWNIDETYPVAAITWDEANAFCGWLNGRLPTEAEWERAARGGKDDLKYAWGAAAVPMEAGRPLANVADETGKRKNPTWQIFFGYDDFYSEASPVESFPPNPYGLFDLAGNVWEWVADWFGPYAAGAVTDPQGPPSGQFRVVRGGSWFNSPKFMRVSSRYFNQSGSRYSDFGARCARDVRP